MLDPLLILDTNDLKRIDAIKEYSIKNPIVACAPGEKNPENPTVDDFIKNHVMLLDIGFEIGFCVDIQPNNRKYQHISIFHESKQTIKPKLVSDIMFLFGMGELDSSAISLLQNNFVIHVFKEIKE